jgi:DNA-binding NarL/FixJ family response regulator
MTENNTEKISFLIADDHCMIRQGISFVIEDLEINHSITEANNLHQIIESVKNSTLDIAILDAQFPDGVSLSLISDIKEIQPQLKILIYSGLDEATHALKFINAGANGFLSKLSEEDEIKTAILRLLNEGEYISSITQSVLLKSLRNPQLVNPISQLSERELQIANMYAEGLGNLEIANQLDIKQNTVSTLKKRIFEKLHIENIVELIEIMKDNI